MTPEEITALKAEAKALRSRMAELKPVIDQMVAYELYLGEHMVDRDEFSALKNKFASISYKVFDAELK